MEADHAHSLAELFDLLADRTRLRIVFALAEGERAAGELARLTGLAPPTVSHHLQLLRLHGLVATRRAHRYVYYRLAPAAAQVNPDDGALTVRPPAAGGRAALRLAPAAVPVSAAGRDDHGTDVLFAQALPHVRRSLGPLAVFVIATDSGGHTGHDARGA